MKIIIQYDRRPEKIVATTFFEKYPTKIAIIAPNIFGSYSSI
jgi:hypothetical protein